MPPYADQPFQYQIHVDSILLSLLQPTEHHTILPGATVDLRFTLARTYDCHSNTLDFQAEVATIHVLEQHRNLSPVVLPLSSARLSFFTSRDK